MSHCVYDKEAKNRIVEGHGKVLNNKSLNNLYVPQKKENHICLECYE